MSTSGAGPGTPRRVLIIGAGGIARRHLKAFLETGRATLAIVEPRQEQRQAMAAAWPLQAAYASLDAVDLSAYDAAVICAPAHVHVPLTTTCIDAGLPVLLEKPLAVNWRGVEALLARAAASGVPVRVAYVRRSDPLLQAARRVVQSGEIGDVRLVHVHSLQDFPHYRPDYRETYYARPEMGGGAILDAASHWIDALIWTMGSVRQVAAIYDHQVLPGVEVEDTVSLQLRFTSGAIGHILICQYQKPNTDSADWVGSLGNVRTEGTGILSRNSSHTGPWERHDLSDGFDGPALNDRRFRIQAAAFLDLLDGRPCALTTLPEAAENLHVALAAKASYRDGRILDLATWQPPEDPS